MELLREKTFLRHRRKWLRINLLQASIFKTHQLWYRRMSLWESGEKKKSTLIQAPESMSSMLQRESKALTWVQSELVPRRERISSRLRRDEPRLNLVQESISKMHPHSLREISPLVSEGKRNLMQTQDLVNTNKTHPKESRAKIWDPSGLAQLKGKISLKQT